MSNHRAVKSASTHQVAVLDLTDPRLREPLALRGGAPAVPEGPPAWPLQDEDVLEALLSAFRGGSWGKYVGGNVARLEGAMAEFHGLRHAVACGSGTFAIELALRALDVGPGDEVALAAYEFPGAYMCVKAVGAMPVLVDVDPRNCNLDLHRLADALGEKTKAVIVSHLHGGIVPMRRVRELAAAHGVRVLEDAAQCPGAWIEGRRAGSWGDVGVLSLGGSKLLSGGRGGVILTDDEALYARAQAWQMRANHLCPLSELQAAVVLPQLRRLDERNRIRHANAEHLRALLEGIPGLAPFRNSVSDAYPGYYKMGFVYEPARFGLARADFVGAVRAEGVALNEGFGPAWLEGEDAGFTVAGDLKYAMSAFQSVVVLHHPVLLRPTWELEHVAIAIAKVHANKCTI